MATANPAKAWHHISLRDPKKWKIVGTKPLGHLDPKTGRSDHGIQVRLGKKGDKGKLEWVTLLFDPRLWTLERAKKWTTGKKHKILEALEGREKPKHDLSAHARAIKHGRMKSELVRDYRDALLEAGVGFEVATPFDGAKVAKTVSWVHEGRGGDVTKEMRFAIKNGVFSDGKRCLLVVPPQLADAAKRLLEMSAPGYFEKQAKKKGAKVGKF